LERGQAARRECLHVKIAGVKQRKNITVTVCRTPEEVEGAEREFLRRLTPSERILSKEALIKNKRATGRPKDLIDLDELEKL
jgi:hypothetical protein